MNSTTNFGMQQKRSVLYVKHKGHTYGDFVDHYLDSPEVPEEESPEKRLVGV
jgi:hypothetical protein